MVDVGGRYLFNKPLLGAVEMSEFLMVFLSFGALALAELRNSHITVDFFVTALPERAQALLDATAALLGIAVLVVRRLARGGACRRISGGRRGIGQSHPPDLAVLPGGDGRLRPARRWP